MQLYEKFLALDEEKRTRILSAALKEFARKRYKDASTNEIVQSAGISKGLLFHYFGSKKNLYLYIYDYYFGVVMKEFFEKFDFEEKDIIERFRQIGLIKLEMIDEYPDLNDFGMNAIVETNPEVSEGLKQRNSSLIAESYQKVFTDFDTSRLKPGLQREQVINVIMWVTQGMSDREFNKLKSDPDYTFDYPEIVKEYEGYIQLLKEAFYR